MIGLTISGLPRAAACPGSAALPQANTTSVDATAGTDNHAAAETALVERQIDKLPTEIRELLVDSQWLAEAAVAYDFEADTARYLRGVTGRAYDTASPPLSESEIAGQIDLLIAHRDERITVVDWKRYEDVGAPDESEQIMGYALAAARVTKATAVRVVVAYIQADDEGNVSLLRPLVVREVDEIDLDAFAGKLRSIVAAVKAQRAKATPDVRENRYCRHCSSVAFCPAKTALLRRIVSGGERDELEGMLPLTPETAREAWVRLGHAKALLKRIEAALYGFAAEVDIPLGDGRVLGRRLKEGNEQLDGKLAHSVVTELFGREVADAAVTFDASKASIERALKTANVKPMAPAMRQVVNALRDRGGARRPVKEDTFEFDAIDYPPAQRQLAQKAG